MLADMARPRPKQRVRAVRRRRAPDVARQEILEAAERVFHEFPPDQVGLKDIGREAGVSHALITHYFGTYAGLIEASLERRLAAIRGQTATRLRESGAMASPSELLAILFTALEEPVQIRLTRWMLASERPAAAHAFALRQRGLQQIAEHVAAAHIKQPPSRELLEAIEVGLLVAVSAAYGYSMCKHALVGSIGRDVSPALDRDVLESLGAMVQNHVIAAVARLSS